MIQEIRKKSLKKALFWSLGFVVLVILSAVFILLADVGLFIRIIAIVCTVAFAIFAAQQWTIIFNKKYLAGIEMFCDQAANPAQMMLRIENTWNNAAIATKYCRMDNEYFVYADGEKSAVISWQDVKTFFTTIYCSATDKTGRHHSTLEIKITFKDGVEDKFVVEANYGKKPALEELRKIESDIINYIEEHHPNIVDRGLWKIIK